jgi:hypothetical protein
LAINGKEEEISMLQAINDRRSQALECLKPVEKVKLNLVLEDIKRENELINLSKLLKKL